MDRHEAKAKIKMILAEAEAKYEKDEEDWVRGAKNPGVVDFVGILMDIERVMDSLWVKESK